MLTLIIPSSFALTNNTLDSDTNSDYYFDITVDIDGNGSEISPYKTLTSDKLIDNSTIHLSDGEYELNKGKTVKNLSVIGQSSQTVLKFKNNNSILTNIGHLTLKNLTLIDVSIINYGVLDADNVTFKNSIGYLKYSQSTNIVNSASNSFGGAIYCPYNENLTADVHINGCIFSNNTAEYGGAIYMCGGNLEIIDSTFLNNYAYNFGGAIAGEYNSNINIERSRFISSRSINDAGGTFYVKNSKLTAKNINISNSSATFGGAITSLSSTVTVNILNATSNHAKYEGGAIYQFYGTLTLRNSHLINNTAKNGGALFIDNTSSTILYQNTFTKNTASDCGGAVYSLLNTKTRINYNQYFENTANFEDDFYETSSVTGEIGSGNYTMYKVDVSDEELPSNYSSLAMGYVTSVKDQQAGGNCWAFAGLAVLESCILKASGCDVDLSEENMKNLMELYSDYGWYMDTNGGGYPSMIMGYLVSWMGPVLEIEDSNDDYSTLSPLLNSYMHVQNVKYITRSTLTDNDEIKRAIMQYGAVGTGIYYDSEYFNSETNAYYGSFTTLTNHAVAIVGWDDNYSRDNFINKPRGDGAFLVKNSWNTDWGNEGYFYVSYYDTSFARVGDSESIYTFILNDTVKYDRNYQYDIPGKTDYFLGYEESIWYQNVFESAGSEFLAAVSTYFEKDCAWDLYIYVNDTLKLVKNGTSSCGYYTIDLGNYIELCAGDIFRVMFKITCANPSFPISEKLVSNKLLYREGISFFSYNGINWTDLYDYSGYYNSHTYSSQVACIKAFTIFDKIATTLCINVSDNPYNPVEITAFVSNQYGYPVSGGNVTFNVYGKDYIVPVLNGIAKLTVDLKELELSRINATFNGVGYFTSSGSCMVNISKIATDVAFDISRNMNSLNITVKLSKIVNETLNVNINTQNYTLRTTDGVGVLSLDFGNGNYTINVNVLNDTFITKNSTFNFTVDVKDAFINASDFETYFNAGEKYWIELTDSEGNPISNRTVSFEINGKTLTNITDIEGRCCADVLLENGLYNVTSIFSGDEDYFNTSQTRHITVKSTFALDKSDCYLLNTNYSFRIVSNISNPAVTIDNKTYDVISLNGSFLVNIDLAPGNYSVSLYNPLNGETVYDNITVISRIVENSDLSMYYTSGLSYNVRVLNDTGGYIAAGESVKFTINGKSYIRFTDKNGYASFKITSKPKTYTIKAEYKGFEVSNKVVVKPVLTAKDISIKKAKTIKFRVKLVNTKGKALKGKIIKFKIKGKAYKAKTNKKGIATLKLKNLKAGKYTVKAKYSKSTIKNTIKVRK